MSRPDSGTYLDRMRQNAAQALAEGAAPAQVYAHVLAVFRKVNRPTATEYGDAAELAELAETMTGFRQTGPGELATDDSDTGGVVAS